MKEIELTRGRAFKFWWSLAWRVFLFTGLAGLVLGFVIGTVDFFMDVDLATAKLLGGIAGIVVSIPINIWVVKWVLGKKFSDFRIALVTMSGTETLSAFALVSWLDALQATRSNSYSQSVA